MPEYKREPLCYLAIFAIIVFHSVNNFLWLRQSTDIVGIDVPNHLYFQLKFHHILSFIISAPGVSFLFKISRFMQLLNTSMAGPYCIYWPNFVYLSSTFFSLIFGNSLLVVKMVNLVYLPILLLSTYAIAKEIVDRRTGLLAMILLSLYPLIFESSRQYGLDLPLAALVTLSILLLLKTNYFTNFYFSIFLGISVGISMLIKGQFIFFFILPLIITIWHYFSIRSIQKFSRDILLNIFMFVVIAILISSIWWFNKIPLTIGDLTEHVLSYSKFLESGNLTKMHDTNFYFYHFKSLIFDSLGAIFAGLFLFSLVRFIKAEIKYKSVLLGWIIMPIFLFSILFVVKHSRFLMPVLPAIAIVSGWGVQQIKYSKLRKVAIFFIILIGLFQYYILSYFSFGSKDGFKKISPLVGYSCYETAPQYDSEKLKLTREAAYAIAGDCKDYNDCRVGIVISGGHIAPFEMMYWLYFWNPNLYIFDWSEYYDNFYAQLPTLGYLIFVNHKEYNFPWPKGDGFLSIAEKNGVTNPGLFRNVQHDWSYNLGQLSAAESKFQLLKTIEFSNGVRWDIYKRIYKNL